MVEITVKQDNLIVEVKGLHSFFALKKKMVFPLTHVRGITADAGIYQSELLKGIRSPGTQIPGLKAGTYYSDGQKSFWDVHRSQNVVVIELSDEEYDRLIVEVKDVQATTELVESSLR